MLTLLVFLAACSLIVLVAMLLTRHDARLQSRVDKLSGEGRDAVTAPAPTSMVQFAQAALPKLAKPILPESGDQRTRLQARLTHAGLYGRHAMGLVLGVKMILMAVPLIVGIGLAVFHIQSPLKCAMFALFGSAAGMMVPGLWLDARKRRRQMNLRRSLPDALDIMVICLEGGVSLQAAFHRVALALRSAHPLLAGEMNIIQREIQLGRTTGEALRQFADRSDLEEVRSLAAVVVQSEKLGASLVKALRVFADSFRIKRLQRAEEMAQKASTKIVFPTILFIFPAILFVIAAPAVFLLMDLFASFNN
jgi:tight adherence protein C